MSQEKNIANSIAAEFLSLVPGEIDGRNVVVVTLRFGGDDGQLSTKNFYLSPENFARMVHDGNREMDGSDRLAHHFENHPWRNFDEEEEEPEIIDPNEN
jgi:hypothetical protein